ncbi:MAG: hypothetical protein LBJ72_14275 [Dysgonamonadaceae bacterium]|nr:hypothetical protein [Dysgonamonadaceae bacterium]
MNSCPDKDSKEKKMRNKVNEIFYGQSDVDPSNQDEFYRLLNVLHENFLGWLSESFPLLNEKEIQICCLLKAGFDTSNICLILKYVPITIRAKKTAIRKKLGITDGGDIIDFLSKFMEKQELEKKQMEEKKKNHFLISFFGVKIKNE